MSVRESRQFIVKINIDFWRCAWTCIVEVVRHLKQTNLSFVAVIDSCCCLTSPAGSHLYIMLLHFSLYSVGGSEHRFPNTEVRFKGQ